MTGRHRMPGGSGPDPLGPEVWPSSAARSRGATATAPVGPWDAPRPVEGRAQQPRGRRRLRVTLAGVVPVVLVASVTVAGLLGTGVLGGVAPADQRVDDHVPVPTFASGPTVDDASSIPMPSRWYGSGTGIAPTTAPVAARETRAAAVADGAVRAATARIAEDRRIAEERRAAEAAARERQAAEQRAAQDRAAQRAREQADARRRAAVPPTAAPTTPPAPTTTPAPPTGTAPDDARTATPAPTGGAPRTEGVVCRVVRFVIVPC
ncbi:hypothetical protein [Pseudonocardia sp. ICBG1034]|uniref:hypothetical protein n=1 Tax=Pseudonocardia sp. ICBG1034 TaxID=2844381 RepID=UPI001CCA3C4A|nr:hypothetical protein [Pseudonocardia sp. ICBG1034]